MERTNVFLAAVWMVVISLLLFFVPLVNGLIGGAIGGYKAGSIKRGLVAAIIPAVVVAIGLWLVLIAFELPVVGFVAGTAVGFLILLADVGLFIGAAIGGAYAQNRRQPVHV